MDEVRDASTVVLARDGEPGLEVFLMRRHHNSGFMGGAYVFPGGKLDDGDCALAAAMPEAVLNRFGERLNPTPGRNLDAVTATALGVAAAREMFEEAGVVLADTHRAAFEAIQSEREPVATGDKGFGAVLEAAGLTLDLGSVEYWAHWITPSVEPKRFDTRFFVAALPAGQRAQKDERETTDQLWATPPAAIASSARGEIMLPPPTFRTLEELVGLTSTAEMLAAAAERVIVPIQPKISTVGEHIAILLPWDPLYDETPGEALAVDATTHPLAASPSRIVMVDGVWQSLRG